jgi:chemotaxis protein methyltransferase CheR
LTGSKGSVELFNMNMVNDAEFQLIRRLIYDKAGIHLRDCKKTLVSNRLRKRLETLGIESYKRYYDFLTKKPEGHHELAHFINALTTNETYFFRHPEHMEYLEHTILPQLMTEKHRRFGMKIRIWCAACSSGEEPYSIAMLIQERPERYKGWHVEIVGSDINRNMLMKAEAGLYPEYAVSKMPKIYRQRYLNFDPAEKAFRLRDDVKSRVRFVHGNLLHPFGQGKFDVILCRNVMIYFDAESKNKVISNLFDDSAEGGYLIVGYAESMLTHPSRFKYVMPTVYRRIGPN